MKKHFVRLFVYLVIIALVLQTTPIQALPITEASSAPRQGLTAWHLEPALPEEALVAGEDLRTPTASELAQTAEQVRFVNCETDVTDVPWEDCQALVDMYFSTNGDGWANSTNWLGTTTVGNWYGVTVFDGHVTEIDLGSNQLNGSIPSSLPFLNNTLKKLHLDSNQLSGSIAPIQNLFQVNSLDLSSNQLSGSIPPLEVLSQINSLDLSSNQLSGSIPSTLGNLGRLEYLKLNNNQLTGFIPESLVDLGNLSDGGLNLSSNYLMKTGYSQTLLDFLASKDPNWASTQQNICEIVTEIPTTECEALVTLYDSTNGPGWATQTNWLANNQPGTWVGVTVTGGHISSLSLGANQMSGTIPAELGNLGSLVYLNLSANQLFSTIPLSFINLVNLESFYFANTSLCEPSSTDFITWKATVTTWSGTDVVCDAFCQTVTDVPYYECDALKTLYGSTNGADWNNNDDWLTSTTVGDWYGVTVSGGYVTVVDLDYNELSGSIPAKLGNLGSLQRLELEDNRLSGSIPAELGKLSSLQRLYLGTNQLSGSIPAELGNLGNLQHLYLYRNQLTGSIPTELGNLSSLIYLYLRYNQMSGSIPAELGNLSSLQRLYLDYNQLTGSIPSQMGSLGSLQRLGLNDNQLSGSIPTELGNISSLQLLLLDDNQLSGSIPSALGNLSSLQQLSLGSNNLTGSIPTVIGNLTNLYHLRLDQNMLSSNVPAEIANLVNLCSLDSVVSPCFGLYEFNLGYNHLNVPAPEPPASFLAIKDPDWHLTQAVSIVIDGTFGGMFFSNDGTTKVEVPAGASSGDITFLFEPQPSPSQSTGTLGFAGSSFRLTAWDSLGTPVTVFSKPITVTITYDEGDLGDIPEESLGLYTWDGSGSAWEDVITACPSGAYTRNLAANWLSAPVCHLSEFALLGGDVYTTYMPLIIR